MALEARGLDVTPETARRLAAAGDLCSAQLISRIARDEERHVAIGVHWFKAICKRCQLIPESTWQSIVSEHIPGVIKAPFNDLARERAGLTREYYSAIAALTSHKPKAVLSSERECADDAQ
jgi:uncharacterized ferritin-like protein (DUF455 family)